MISSNKNSTDNTNTLPLLQKANINGDLVQQELNELHYYKRQTWMVISSNRNSTNNTTTLPLLQKTNISGDLVQQELS